MKHTFKVTILLLSLFFVAQIVGLTIVSKYVTYEHVIEDGKVTTERTWSELPYELERPEFEAKTSFIPILFIILLATGLVLLIAKFQALLLWKAWFFLSVLFCLIIGFGAFFQEWIALGVALVLTIIKVSRKSLLLHNFTELFIYGGLAAIFVPILNLLSISILLILISVYDFIAVHKTKHMIVLAKFQTKAKLFAGLLIPYAKNKTAVLGGGDIAFPLMFTAVLMSTFGLQALITTITATLGLGYLLWKSEHGKSGIRSPDIRNFGFG